MMPLYSRKAGNIETEIDESMSTTSDVFKIDLHNEVLSSALAENTRIAYEKGWSCFEKFCSRRDLQPLAATPENIADFMIDLATRPRPLARKIPVQDRPLSMGTVVLYRSAINRRFVESGIVSPTNHPSVNTVLKGLVRLRGRPARQVKALREYHIKKILAVCDRMYRTTQ